MPDVIQGPYKIIETRGFGVDAVFEPRPSSLVLIASLEIVVKDSHGTYLLVTSPQYEPVETTLGGPLAKVEDAFWTVPYITRTVQSPDDGFKNVSPTIDAIDKTIKSWKPDKKLTDYAQTLSIGATGVKLVQEFCEFKRSWSQPHMMALYHIMRYSLELGNCDHRNLADAASRKGFSFIPIDDDRYKRFTKARKCKRHERQETLYLSRPLTSNLAAVLDHNEHRRELRNKAVTLQQEHFWQQYTGFLFCGDIAGYGAANAYASESMSGFDDVDPGAVLRDSATVGFTDLFLQAGISQVHTAGDGFICALPLENGTGSEVRRELKNFAHAYAAYLARLDDLSKRVAAHFEQNPKQGQRPPIIGSRLAIHYGEYRYGKMSEAASLLTSFDGRQIVTVSRLEQGLSSIAKSPSSARKHNITADRHLAIASTAVTELLGDEPVLPNVFEGVAHVKASSKEYSDHALLMRAIKTKVPRSPKQKASGEH